MLNLLRCQSSPGQTINRPIRGLFHSQVQIWLFQPFGPVYSLLPRHEGSFERSAYQNWYYHIKRVGEGVGFNRVDEKLSWIKYFTSEGSSGFEVYFIGARVQLKLQRRDRFILFICHGGGLFQIIQVSQTKCWLRDLTGHPEILRLRFLEPAESGYPHSEHFFILAGIVKMFYF